MTPDSRALFAIAYSLGFAPQEATDSHKDPWVDQQRVMRRNQLQSLMSTWQMRISQRHKCIIASRYDHCWHGVIESNRPVKSIRTI
ncbi:MAG: hypothetical protein ACK52S_00285 [Pirellula sp.]